MLCPQITAVAGRDQVAERGEIEVKRLQVTEGKTRGRNKRKLGEAGVLPSPSSYCSCRTGQ